MAQYSSLLQRHLLLRGHLRSAPQKVIVPLHPLMRSSRRLRLPPCDSKVSIEEREALASLLRATQPNPNGRRPSTHPPSPRRHRNRPSAHLARLARMAAAGSCSQIQRRGVGRPPWHLDDSDSKLKAASGSSTSRQRRGGRGGGGPPSRWPPPIPIAVGGGRHPRRRRGARLALGG
jgi:hypothetical protein